jgi:serine/threonine protein kinase
MPLAFVCEKEHARLPDAWERNSFSGSLGTCAACGAAVSLQEVGSDVDPRLIIPPPDYEILSHIDGQTMADVLKARHRTSGNLVALKISSSAPDATTDDRLRVRREAQNLRDLDHPHIVRLLEAGEVGKRTFFTMEWLSGGELADRLCGGPLPPREAVLVMAKLSDAIHHSHLRRIVHRDLRPSNVVFSDLSEPKLVDFGLSKRLDRPGGRTRNGAMSGDPRYMAPEQAGRNAQVIGPAVDIHALGAILYHILSGRLPFQEICLNERLRRSHIHVPPLTDIQPSLPSALDDICLRCLHREPKRRYTTAAELADDLRRVLDRELRRGTD